MAMEHYETISATHSPAYAGLALVQRLLARAITKAGQMRLRRQLAALPDHILLDIGIDPRDVPNAAGELIPRPDLTQTGMAAPIWRTTAKS